ncbi:NADPH-dependent ferric siderophore reductase [Clavibacter sp. B3I6]|nr:NADPH-dependent ferric siderophore reductase [Clavibacter sp. B3I6]
MLTSTATLASSTAAVEAVVEEQPAVQAPEAERPAYRPFAARVARTQRLSPTFLRITFQSDDLRDFGDECLDQRIKLLLPVAEHGLPDLTGVGGDDWFAWWRALPDAERNPLRTYTSRAVRRELGELDIDFALHGDMGPASRWAGAAQVGDDIVVIGPDALSPARGLGIEWHPGHARSLLLAGDETAAPAICNILSSLPDDAVGCAFIEVPVTGDRLDVRVPKGVNLTWLPRDGRPNGSRLEEAVRRWVDCHVKVGALAAPDAAEPEVALADEAQPLAEDDAEAIVWDAPVVHEGSTLYAWLAGESGCIKAMRRFLVRDTGIDRRQVAFMGYWRAGAAEGS